MPDHTKVFRRENRNLMMPHGCIVEELEQIDPVLHKLGMFLEWSDLRSAQLSQQFPRISFWPPVEKLSSFCS